MSEVDSSSATSPTPSKRTKSAAGTRASRAAAAAVLSALGPQANATAGLEGLVRKAWPHATRASDGVVVDERALFLGLMAFGMDTMLQQSQGRTARDRRGNAAGWLVLWLAERLRATQSLSSTEFGSDDVQLFSVERTRIDSALYELFAAAADIAKRTVRREAFDLRHLVAAMTVSGVLVQQLQALLGIALDATQLADFARTFVSHIDEGREKGEDMLAWRSVFDLPSDESPGAPAVSSDIPSKSQAPDSSPQPAARSYAERVAAFSPDLTDGRSDPLGTAGDVEALAKLICLEDVTPLSLAVFGGWGAGKTTFMNRLDKRVREIASAETARRRAAGPAPHGAKGYVRSIAPIWFNAWQFVDANLWASLTAELFDQLRSGGPEGAGARQHAALIERVNAHVHALSDEANAKRQAAAESAKAADDAKSARDAAALALKTKADDALGREVLETLSDTYRAEKPKLEAMGLGSSVASMDAFIKLARASDTALGRAGAVLRLTGQTRLGWTLAAVLALVGLAAWTIFWISSGKPGGIAVLTGLVTLATFLGSAATALGPAVRLVGAIAGRLAAGAAAIRKAGTEAGRAYLEQEQHFRQASAAASEKQADADTAARAFSSYADPKAGSNPPRLLRYLLEDDPDTRALEKEIGLIGRTRRLFRALDYLMRHDANAEGEASLERIVIFIDDLDRCTEEQVYHALQATQLLLAFKSFVVVVGVDVEWVQQTLAKQMAGSAHKGEAGDRQKAMSYLEKIFQVAFWLAPLSGPDGGGYAAYVHTLADPAAPPRPPPPPPQPTSGPPTVADPAHATAPGASPSQTPLPSNADVEFVAQEPAAESADQDAAAAALEIVQLDQVEADFLASPTIAAIAAHTPRSVKRLINVYRLARARVERISSASLMGDPPDYPLIAFFAAVETGQPPQVANDLFRGLEALSPTMSLAGSGAELATAPDAGEAHGASDWISPDLSAALAEVVALRGGRLTAQDALRVARAARRYSLNRLS